jgi:hypothetical protein
VVGFSGLNPRAARAPGAENALQEGASFFPSRVFYPLHSRHRAQTTIPPIPGAVPACEPGGVFGAATINIAKAST